MKLGTMTLRRTLNITPTWKSESIFFKSNMADGRYFWKYKNRHFSSTVKAIRSKFDKLRPRLTMNPISAPKFDLKKNPRCRTAIYPKNLTIAITPHSFKQLHSKFDTISPRPTLNPASVQNLFLKILDSLRPYFKQLTTALKNLKKSPLIPKGLRYRNELW